MNSLLMGRTARGIVEGDAIPDIFIPALLELHAQGRFPFDRLIEVYDFERIDAAARDSEEGRVVKPVLRM
jgi:aryl-alcohol dehydrogenase